MFRKCIHTCSFDVVSSYGKRYYCSDKLKVKTLAILIILRKVIFFYYSDPLQEIFLQENNKIISPPCMKVYGGGILMDYISKFLFIIFSIGKSSCGIKIIISAGCAGAKKFISHRCRKVMWEILINCIFRKCEVPGYNWGKSRYTYLLKTRMSCNHTSTRFLVLHFLETCIS